jgi:TP901 family phage tail tape measure protein
MGVIANLTVRIGADVSGLEKQLQGLDRTLARTGSQLKGLGERLTTGLTLPLAAIGGVAVKAAADFDSAFANVRKTVDASEAQLAKMETGIRDMAKQIPVAATELANIAAIGGQFGVSSENVLGFTEVVARLGVAIDGISVDAAAESLAQIGKVTGTSEKEFSNMASTLVDLGNKGASTEGAILETTKRLAAAGTQAGLSTAQIFGLGAAMANLGIEAEAGGTALSKTLRSITSAVSSGGKELQNYARVAGMTSEAFSALFKRDAAAALNAVINGFGRLKAEGTDLTKVFDQLDLKDARQMDALTRLALAQGEVSKQMNTASEAYRKNTALAEESSKKFGTFWNQVQLLKNQLTDIAITIGGPLLKSLRGFMDGLKPVFQLLGQLAKAFADLPQWVQSTILVFGALVAAVGPLVYIAGTLISSWGAIAGLFGTTATGFSLAAVGAKALAFTLGVLLNPITWVVAAIAGLVLGLRYLTGSWEGVLRVLSGGVLDFETLGRAWDAMKQAGSDLVRMLGDLAGAIGSVVSPAFQALGQVIHTVWNSEIVGLIKAVAELAAEIAGWAFITAAKAAWAVLTAGIQGAIDTVKQIRSIFEGIANFVRSDMGPVLNWLRDTFVSVFKTAGEWVNWLFGQIKNAVQALEGLITGVGKLPKVPAAPKLFATPTRVPVPERDIKALLTESEALAKTLLAGRPPAGGGWGDKGEEEAKKLKKALEDAAQATAEFQAKLTDATTSGVEKRLAQIERERQAELKKIQGTGAAFTAARAAIEAYYDHEVSLALASADTIIERMRAQGVETREDHQRTVDALRAQYEQMAASGEFAYAELKAAYDKYVAAIGALPVKVSIAGVSSVLAELDKIEDRYKAIRDAGTAFQHKLTEATATGVTHRIELINRERQAELEKYKGIDAESTRTRAAINAYYDHQVAKANETFDTIEERMHEAGIATRADVQEAARYWKHAYEQMKESGLYTYEQLEEARRRWMQAEEAATTTWGENWIGAFGKIADEFGKMAGQASGVWKDVFGSLQQGMSGLEQAAQVAKDTGSNWGIASTMFDKSAKGMDRIAAGAKVATAVASGIMNIAKATDKASAGARALGGAMAGLQAGAQFGPWGAGIGAAAGLVTGLLRGKPKWAKAMAEVGRDLGLEITEEMGRKIADEAKTMFKGDRAVAIQANLAAIMKEAGVEIDTSNVDKWTKKVRDSFSLLERKAKGFTKGMAAQNLDQVFGQLVEASTKSSQLLKKNVKELITLNDRFGTESAAIAQYVAQEMGRATGGISTFLENATVTSQESATAIGAALVGLFDQIAGKEGIPAALQAIAPAMKQLETQMLAAGFTGTVAFDAIRKMVNWASDDINSKAIAAIEGLNQGLIGLENSGLLTQEMFAGLTRQITETYQSLVDQGRGGAEALALMKPTLQTIYELQEDFGYELDETTQGLVDQAVAAGLVGEKFRDASERMANAMDKVSEILTKIAEKMGVEFPADVEQGANEAAAGIEGAFQDVHIDPIEVPYVYTAMNEPPAGVPALADGAVVTRPTLALIGERGPEVVAPLRDVGAAEQTIIVNLDSRTLATQTVKAMPRVVRLYGG